jgi:outer membrane protein
MRRIFQATLPASNVGRRRHARWLIATSLCTALCGLAQAEDASLDGAAAPIGAHDAATAYAELAPQERARAGDPRFDYLLGLAALDSGHVTHAIFALERVLARRPDDHPARAELARAYLATGESESARAELVKVRRTEMPQDAAAAIDRVLGLLDQVAPSDRPTFAGYAEIGGGWDSNVNSATSAGQFAIPAFGGLLFNVAPGNGRTSDRFATAAAGASAQVPMARGWSLVGGIDARGNLNATAHDLNTSVASGSVGASHVEGRQAQTLALQTNAAWISSSLYRTASGASLQWQWQPDAASQMSAFAQWSRLIYTGQNERDADRSVLGSAYARQFGATGTLVYASLYVAEERARNREFAYHGHRATGLRLGGEQTLAKGSVLFAEWQRESRRYGGSEPLFDVRRDDRQNDLLAGLRFALASQWQLISQIRRTAASSNVVLYDYGRTVFQLSLRREFK